MLALTGFHYSGVDQVLTLAPNDGLAFWSNGYAYGTMHQKMTGKTRRVTITLLKGTLGIGTLKLSGFGRTSFESPRVVREGEELAFDVRSSS